LESFGGVRLFDCGGVFCVYEINEKSYILQVFK
jgi:hypothetical protein